MDLKARDFFNGLGQLLPKGPAWAYDSGILFNYLDAWSQEFARIHARINDLVTEADPRTTTELLSDYERVFGLPTDCTINLDQTLAQRRAALVTQMASIGGQSPAYFIDLAAQAGYTITITEFKPFTVADTVDMFIYGGDWRFCWQVNSTAGGGLKYFDATSGVDEYLVAWGNEQLECLIKRFKPAHTTVLFAYT